MSGTSLLTKLFILQLTIRQCSSISFLPVVINTWRFTNATAAAMRALQAGKGAEESLVIGCSTCEKEQCDGSVGYGSNPDESGETTLDAMIMDGDTFDVGAVGDLRRVKNAIGVAQTVMRYSDHTLLVGESATKFAVQMGFKEESLSTNKSVQMFIDWLNKKCQPNFRKNVSPDSNSHCGPYKPEQFFQQPLGDINHEEKYARKAHAEINRYNHDTIGMAIVDVDRHVWVGTTTNGANHKVPGRVGDSPIMGAGAYANSQVGAAAQTGDGDIMMRFLPSFKTVTLMEHGATPAVAAQEALSPIIKFYPTFSGAIIAVDRDGNYGAACHGFETFWYSVASPQFETVKIFQMKCK